MSLFEKLNAINVNEHTEKKNGLTYLSWAWAWAELKKICPEATYTIYENKDGLNYHHDGNTAWVKTGVTVDGIEMIEMLPIMDFKNRSIPLGQITSFDVNKAIQRSLTKAVARHGLGLYIYAGEDLPEGEEEKDAPPAYTGKKPPESTMKVEMIPAKDAPVVRFDPSAALKNWCKRNKVSMDEFGKLRQMAIDGGHVEDVPSAKLSVEQFDQLIRGVEKVMGL